MNSGGSNEDANFIRKQWECGDRYVLDMSQDVGNRIDRRQALAMGVMLDTGERR